MQPARRRPPHAADLGAVSVEFALLFPLLVMFLFGVIQYGYGLFQYQSFASAMNDASRVAATGVRNCGHIGGLVAGIMVGNGLPVDADHPVKIDVRWLDAAGQAAAAPQRLNWIEVRGSYEEPLDLELPLVPFPDRFEVTRRALVQDLVPGVGNSLQDCPPTTAVPGA